MTNMQPFRIALLAGCLLCGSIASPQETTPPRRPQSHRRSSHPAHARARHARRAGFHRGHRQRRERAYKQEWRFPDRPRLFPRARARTVKPFIPQGKVQQFVMDSKDSKFYPGIAREVFGTVDPNNPKTLIVETHAKPYQRTITVYVPAQYKRGATGAVHRHARRSGARQADDPRCHGSSTTSSRRSACRPWSRSMIQNGGGDAQGSQRGLEYDTMSGKFAEFIEAEVLPAVEKNSKVKLTRNPKGRAVMGCSSGAAAALSMAWYHPEWYPTRHQLLRHVREPAVAVQPARRRAAPGVITSRSSPTPRRKPIRIWMHVGDRDLYNPNVMRDDMHDWVVANHRMAKVLKDKGYDYQYVYALDSGHCDKKVREQTLPQALEWVWRGY